MFPSFKEDEETLQNIKNAQPEAQPKDAPIKKEDRWGHKKDKKEEKDAKIQKNSALSSVRLSVYIDFITLKHVFEKYKDEEFKQKVILNIKTAMHIIIKFAKVPKSQSSAEIFKSIKRAPIITIIPAAHVTTCGVPCFLWIFEDFREKVISCHGI